MTKYKISMILSAEEFMAVFPRIGGNVQLEIKKIEDSAAPSRAAHFVQWFRQGVGQRGDSASPRPGSGQRRPLLKEGAGSLSSPASRRPRFRLASRL